MKYSFLAVAALLLPPQAIMVQACDATAQGILDIERESETVKAKGAAAKTDSIDVLVGEYDLTSSGEFVRIFLDKGQIYRVEFTSQTGNLQIRPRRSSEQPALPLTIEDIPRASGTRALQIAPRQDGEYDFRITGTSGFGARLRVFREIEPSARWRRISGRRA